MDKAPVLAHSSPSLKALYEAVRNHLETMDCLEHIARVVNQFFCGLIDEGCYNNDTDCLILVQSINTSNRLLFIRKDKYVFAILKIPEKRTPSLEKGYEI